MKSLKLTLMLLCIVIITNIFSDECDEKEILNILTNLHENSLVDQKTADSLEICTEYVCDNNYKKAAHTLLRRVITIKIKEIPIMIWKDTKFPADKIRNFAINTGLKPPFDNDIDTLINEACKNAIAKISTPFDKIEIDAIIEELELDYSEWFYEKNKFLTDLPRKITDVSFHFVLWQPDLDITIQSTLGNDTRKKEHINDKYIAGYCKKITIGNIDKKPESFKQSSKDKKDDHLLSMWGLTGIGLDIAWWRERVRLAPLYYVGGRIADLNKDKGLTFYCIFDGNVAVSFGYHTDHEKGGIDIDINTNYSLGAGYYGITLGFVGQESYADLSTFKSENTSQFRGGFSVGGYIPVTLNDEKVLGILIQPVFGWFLKKYKLTGKYITPDESTINNFGGKIHLILEDSFFASLDYSYVKTKFESEISNNIINNYNGHIIIFENKFSLSRRDKDNSSISIKIEGIKWIKENKWEKNFHLGYVVDIFR